MASWDHYRVTDVREHVLDAHVEVPRWRDLQVLLARTLAHDLDDRLREGGSISVSSSSRQNTAMSGPAPDRCECRNRPPSRSASSRRRRGSCPCSGATPSRPRVSSKLCAHSPPQSTPGPHRGGHRGSDDRPLARLEADRRSARCSGDALVAEKTAFRRRGRLRYPRWWSFGDLVSRSKRPQGVI